MTLNAGQAPTAATVLHLQPVVYEGTQTGNGGGVQALTTTETDLLACSVTFTSATAATCELTAVGHFLVVTGSNGVLALVRVSVDGSTITPPEVRCWCALTSVEITTSQVVKFTLSGAGSHTVKLRGLKTGAGGTINIGDNHTHFVLKVYEVV